MMDEEEDLGKLANYAYRKSKTRDDAVRLMIAINPDLSTFQGRIMWEAIDAYEDDVHPNLPNKFK